MIYLKGLSGLWRILQRRDLGTLETSQFVKMVRVSFYYVTCPDSQFSIPFPGSLCSFPDVRDL